MNRDIDITEQLKCLIEDYEYNQKYDSLESTEDYDFNR